MQETHPMTRQEAVEELRKYDIQGAQMYLIDIIPLIEMLWANGKAPEGDTTIFNEYINHHVAHINAIAGHEVLTIEIAHAFVSRFLQERPDASLLETLHSLIAPIRLSGSGPMVSNIFRESLLVACLDIAPLAVTDFHELHERFKLAEKQCFFEIAESL